jgi:hypothetical protein
MRTTTSQQEEHAARKQQRNLERARRAAAHKRNQDWRMRLHEKARELRPKHPTCRCDLTNVHTRADLQALGGGCTMPRWTCPFLAALRRTTDPNPGTSPR